MTRGRPGGCPPRVIFTRGKTEHDWAASCGLLPPQLQLMSHASLSSLCPVGKELKGGRTPPSLTDPGPRGPSLSRHANSRLTPLPSPAASAKGCFAGLGKNSALGSQPGPTLVPPHVTARFCFLTSNRGCFASLSLFPHTRLLAFPMAKNTGLDFGPVWLAFHKTKVVKPRNHSDQALVSVASVPSPHFRLHVSQGSAILISVAPPPVITWVSLIPLSEIVGCSPTDPVQSNRCQ